MAEASGKVTDRTAKPFVFDQHSTIVDGIIAATKRAFNAARVLIDQRCTCRAVRHTVS